jgi:hypothetical protein
MRKCSRRMRPLGLFCTRCTMYFTGVAHKGRGKIIGGSVEKKSPCRKRMMTKEQEEKHDMAMDSIRLHGARASGLTVTGSIIFCDRQTTHVWCLRRALEERRQRIFHGFPSSASHKHKSDGSIQTRTRASVRTSRSYLLLFLLFQSLTKVRQQKKEGNVSLTW